MQNNQIVVEKQHLCFIEKKISKILLELALLILHFVILYLDYLINQFSIQIQFQNCVVIEIHLALKRTR